MKYDLILEQMTVFYDAFMIGSMNHLVLDYSFKRFHREIVYVLDVLRIVYLANCFLDKNILF